MTDCLWQLDDVTVPGRTRPRLDGVTLRIPRETTALIGDSGAGKTSLLNLLVGFETTPRGSVQFHGAPHGDALLPRRLPVYWCPADGGLWPHLTAHEHLKSVHPHAGQAAQVADRLLDEFDLADRRDVRPGELSQGERSRLTLARGLATEASVLVMDEPLAHVDAKRIGRCWRLLRDWAEQGGASLVFSTHTPETVLREADHVICLEAGRVLWQGDVQTLYRQPPNPTVARFLGPANWFDPSEARRWLDVSVDRPVCLRPEQLHLEEHPQGALIVERSTFAGAIADADVADRRTGETRQVFFRPADDRLRAGATVVLKAALALCLLLGLAGCGSAANGEALAVTSAIARPMPAAEDRFPAPRGLNFDPAGRLYILDDVGRVLLYGADGVEIRRWWMPEYSIGRPEGVCVLKDGRIAVADTHYNRVVFFHDSSEVVGMLGTFGRGPGEFIYTVDVAQDESGNLYVAEYGGNDRVQKFTAEGEFLLQFGRLGMGPGEFQRASGIVWHEGRVYVADAMNSRIQVFTDDGVFERIFADSKTAGLHYPYDIAIAADGTFYVAEYGAGRVSRLDADGAVMGRYGGTGRGENNLWTPWGVAVGPDGRIAIADTGNRRLVELRL